ncbi:MAG TPA: SpoIIE family protein phosphatase [Trebonia sp.]|jgi:PAS domain S-box-containing protein|nr:SpoIIE family protein phosphatase [Trebonia sp.]
MSADTSVPKQREAGLDEFGSWLSAAVLRDASVGAAYICTEMRFVWVNSALARMYGKDEPEFADRPIAEVWPAVDAARAEAALAQVFGEDRPATETFAGGADTLGGPRAFHWFPVHGPDGTVTGAGLFVVSGALGPATEEALRRSEERYRALVQGGAQVIWVASPDGEMLEDSAEWRWITGQTTEEFLGGGWLDSIHSEDRDRVERDWRDCLRTGRIFDDRFRMRTRGGAYRHYDVRAVPIERDAKIAEWVGACTDVTSQREAEEMRGRLTEQLSAAALRTARLQQATSMLAEALTVEQVVEVITEVGRTAIGALRSAVALLDSESLRLRVVNTDGLAPVGPDAVGQRLTLDTPSVMTRAIATRRPVLVPDVDELRKQFEGDEDGYADGVRRFEDTGDERSWVGLPLLAAGAPLGALRFSFNRPRRITEEERVFLEALAGQCALAVERAAMYEREHATAETLQRSLLPDKLPLVPGLDLDARYLPVTRNMEIGGDWYDVFRLPDRRLAVTVGDVMGKGLQAAAGMGRVRNALRALALTDPRPAAVLAGLDRLFAATELEEQVTTVSYLVIDPETGEGQAGNAGHLPTLLLTPGALPVLDETEAGTPLGWPSPRRQHAFRLPPGSSAVFYSDGLVENRVRGLDSGLDELVRVAASASDDLLTDPGRLLQYLLDHMLAGHEQDDDVTVLVMHVPTGRGEIGVALEGSPGQEQVQQRVQR